jgi:hypothetical protein
METGLNKGGDKWKLAFIASVESVLLSDTFEGRET